MEKNFKKDVVYLYQFPRSATIPSVSPYCLKIETFLRVNKIPYENRFLVMGRSKHGLLPFVELNGEQVADSQMIYEKLVNHFNIKVTAIKVGKGPFSLFQLNKKLSREPFLEWLRDILSSESYQF